jgi:hypothetical protein
MHPPVLTAALSGGSTPCHVRATAADTSSSVRHCLLGSVKEGSGSGSRHGVTSCIEVQAAGKMLPAVLRRRPAPYLLTF